MAERAAVQARRASFLEAERALRGPVGEVVAGIARRPELSRLQDDLVVPPAIQPVAAGGAAGRDRGLLAAVVADKRRGVRAGRVTDQAGQLIDVPHDVARPGGAEIEP